jgi:hypothetical protein
MEAHIQQIQELSRVIDATLASVDHNGLIKGHTAMDTIKFLINRPGMEKYVGEEFFKFVNSEFEQANGKINIREHVKRIWTYPNFKYEPWNILDIDKSDVSRVKSVLKLCTFNPEVKDGKVFFVPNTNISNNVYNILRYYLNDDIVPNTESSHLTIINSNIVADIGIDKVVKFVKNYDIANDIEFEEIKHTESYDWSVFSKCYVIAIKSDTINNFVNNFNKDFNKTVKLSLHMTFAIKPRSI